MKKHFLLTAHIFLLSFTGLNAQVIVVTPPLPTDIDGVEVVFDANQGSGGLANYTGDVYAHTGVITNLSTSNSDWKYVKAGWGVNIPDCKLTSLGNNKWKLVIGPDIRQYYGVPAAEHIPKMAFVFRSGVTVNGSYLEGKAAGGADIFYDVYPSGLTVSITSPDQSLVFEQLNQSFTVSVSSFLADTTILYSGGQRIASTTGTTLTQDITPTAYGRFLVKAEGKNSTGMVADSFYYYVRPAVPVAEVPAGITEGINYLGDNTAILCLYAPLKQYAFVIGDFNDWLPDPSYYMNRTPDGKRYWLQLNNLVKSKEYIFQYLVDGSIRIGDPYAHKVSDPWNDQYIDTVTYPGLIQYPAGKTTGVATVLQTAQPVYSWQHPDFTPPAATDLVIYELLIRDFTAEHSFQSVMDSLAYLKKLGINAIEFMPVSEFEGNLSWGYNPNYYLAVDKYYGPGSKFKELIDACHSQGIAVIMDIVLNHAFGTSPYVMLYWDGTNNRPSAESPFYNTVAKHDYNVGFDMNHESPDTKYYVSRILKYWLSEYNIDGYRFDLSKGFTQTNTLGNTTAWGLYDQSRVNILSAYHDTITATNPKAQLILEHFADNSEEKVLSAKGMLLWGKMNYNYTEAAKGDISNSNISSCAYTSRGWTEPGLVGYIESHDEERLMFGCESAGNFSGSYSTRDTVTALGRAALAATFFFTIPGPKMIWQFEERGYDYSINWPSGTSTSRLDSKPPRWDYMDQFKRKKLYNTFTALIKLREENPLFKTTNFSLDVAGALKTIHLKNDTLAAVVVGNFDVSTATVAPVFYSTGKWYDYLTGDSLTVSDVNGGISLKAGEARLYMNRRVANPYGISLSPGNILLDVYPNPVTEQCNILINYPGRADCKVTVFNIQGINIATVYEGTVHDKLQLQWKPQGRGLFFIRVTIGNSQSVRKVIVP